MYEHLKFFKTDPIPGERFDQFLTLLKQLSSTCELKEKDVMILTRIVHSISDKRMQENALAPERGTDICRVLERSSQNRKEILNKINADSTLLNAILNSTKSLRKSKYKPTHQKYENCQKIKDYCTCVYMR